MSTSYGSIGRLDSLAGEDDGETQTLQLQEQLSYSQSYISPQRVKIALVLVAVGLLAFMSISSIDRSASGLIQVSLDIVGFKGRNGRKSETAETDNTAAVPEVDQTITGKTATGMPNIVFVLADDLGWNAIGYQNFDLSFVSPNLNTLASEGLILANYYAQEVCTPSRASLLTGRYPLSVGMQYGVVDIYTPWGLDLQEETLAEVLSDAGYATAIIGKWHLGHHSPRYLPTARGFDSFVGYLDGDNYYYSKRNPQAHTFHDFMSATRDCYSPYVDINMHNYSTHLYRQLAVDIIEQHDQAKPLFLYLPFQAVHYPFQDIIDGKEISSHFVEHKLANQIRSDVQGMKRRLVAYALNILDTAVGSIVGALERTGMMDNTYVIFASDNGGCYAAGGKNGPLRGTKGTVLEGGTKVDAFVYSPLLSDSAAGTLYNNIFHVSDWFPTLLDLAGIEYVQRDGFELDGFSHAEAFSDPTAAATAGLSVRTHMLYNSYYNVEAMDFDMWSNGPFAVRNEQYKLIHFFNSSTHAAWYQSEEILDDDAVLEISTQCTATSAEALSGDYVYGLYDLINDPYEQYNLYDEDSEDINAVKEELYAQLDIHHAKAKPSLKPSIKSSEVASVVWQEAGGFVSPFVKAEDETSSSSSELKGATFDATKTYPSLCSVSTDMAYSRPL